MNRPRKQKRRKRPEPEQPRWVAAGGLLLTPWVLGLVLVALLVAGVVYAWHQFGPEILADPQYTLTAEMIQITPQPDWIREDIKAEVVRDGSLDQLKLYDRQLLGKVADAFAVHSWVAKVRRVRKAHGRVVVELVYRRPVAMVEVLTSRGPGLVFIDAQGVILPSADFTEEQTRQLLRIAVPGVKSYGVVGTPWGDDRVHQAARIAEALKPLWKQAGLYRIAVRDEPRLGMQFVLQTRSGTTVLWGSAIGQESDSEVDVRSKLAALKRYVSQHGSLDAGQRPQELDLRSGSVGRLATRAAAPPGKR